MSVIVLIGRILFSAIFIIKSFDHFTQDAVQKATTAGVPYPDVLVPVAGVFAFLGGLSMLLGYRARFGALLLIIFLLPTTFYMHKFWTADTSFEQMMHNYCFFKNIALLGAALMFTHFGSGPLSLDSKKAPPAPPHA